MPSTTCITRRQLLRWSAGTLLAGGLWPGVLKAADADRGEDYHFLVVNDLHYFDKNCNPWFDKVIKQMKDHKEKIDFCIVAGDLVEDGKPEQIAPIRDLLKGLSMPVHVVIGNHDYLAQDDRKAFEEAFPNSLNYHFEHRGWQFVGLDTSEGKKASAAAQPATMRWIAATLPKLDKKRPMVLFTHFPLGPLVPQRLRNADDLLAPFKEYNLIAAYSGHFHSLQERTIGQTVLTTDRCCSFHRNNHDGDKLKGYFLCHARGGKIERTFVEVKPV